MRDNAKMSYSSCRVVFGLAAAVALASACQPSSQPKPRGGEKPGAETTTTGPHRVQQDPVPPQTSSVPPLATNSALGVYPEHVNDGSEVAVLRDEGEFLNARWKLLDSAKQAVWIQTYIFKADYSGRQFAKRLLELKKRGIDVRIVTDEQANLAPSSQSQFASLYRSGLAVVGFNPLYRGILFPLSTSGNIGTFLDQQNKRSHEKMFIIDPQDPVNKRAIIGGTNISDDYFSILPAPSGGYWRDKDVMLRGPVVDDIADNFKRSLAYHVSINSNISSGAVVPPTLSTIIQGLLSKPEADNPVAAARFKEHTSKPFNPSWHGGTLRFLVQSMVTGTPDIYNSYLKVINGATSEVIIANGYFIPNQEQIDALKAAARRGVRVRILSNSEETSDFPQVARAGRLMYPLLLNEPALPLEIFEWGIPNTKAYGLYHSKFICVDRVQCLVGSFNMDPRSRKLNNEVSISFISPAAAAEMSAIFDRDVAPTTSTKITPEMAQQLSTPNGLKDQALNTLIKSFLHIF